MNTSILQTGFPKAKAAPETLRARIESKDGNPVVWIYSDIGESDESTENIVRSILSLPRDKTVLVRINSRGGLAFDGLAIYSALREHGRVITRVDGVAASAAAIIALAGNVVQMQPAAMLFFHRAWAVAIGNAKLFRDTADSLEKLDDNIATILATKAGISKEEALAILDGEVDGTWYTAEQALDAGFIDAIVPSDSDDNGGVANKQQVEPRQEASESIEEPKAEEPEEEPKPADQEPQNSDEEGGDSAPPRPSEPEDEADKLIDELYEELCKGETHE